MQPLSSQGRGAPKAGVGFAGTVDRPCPRSYPPLMKTEIYESDPFSPQKGALLTALDTDYRFERNDELFITTGGKRIKVRVIHIRVDIDGDQLRRELLALRL